MEKKKKEIKRTLKLEGKLTIYEAEALRESLKITLGDADILEFDISDVRECDTSVLQLLCSAKKSADQKDKKICIFMTSGAVRDAMTLTGITHEMIAHDGGTGCQR